MARTLLFFGDSLTAGYGLGLAQAFPALLQLQLEAEGLPYRVVNAGRSGDTTTSGLARLDATLAAHPQPAVFVLELGANDGLRGYPPAVTEANLDAILTRVRQHHPTTTRCLLLGMELPPLLGGPFAAAFGALFRAVAGRHNATLVPFLLNGIILNPALTLPDRVHPNAAGQRRMADVVWPALRPLLTRAPPAGNRI